MITEFDEEIKQWVDPDGLIGNKKNPEKWSSGNGLLETAFAFQAAKKQGSIRWMHSLEEAAFNCFQNGVLNKNPGRPDQITHDCIIGFASINSQLADLICQWGNETGWVLSNTGDDYFTAHAKPWHVAYFKAASSKANASLWECLIFWLWAILALNFASLSGARLWWLMRNARPPKFEWLFGPVFDLIFKKRFQSINKVNAEYYDPLVHINSRWL